MNNYYYPLGIQVIIVRISFLFKLLFLNYIFAFSLLYNCISSFQTFTKLTQMKAYQESNDKTALQTDTNICFHY